MRYLPSKESEVVNGVVWGEKIQKDYVMYIKMQEVGIVHIMVASGANVLLVAGGVVELGAGVLGRKKMLILGLVLGWWYAYISGFNPPVVRAILFLSIKYWAQLLGRVFCWWRALIVVVAIIIFSDFSMLTSLSLWMSVLAFLAVISFDDFVKRGEKSTVIREFKRSVWVGLWLTPLTAAVFGKVSSVLPLQSLCM
jgi:competence protein ComEC